MTSNQKSSESEASLPEVDRIVSYLRSSARGPLKPKELSRALDVDASEYGAFQDLLGRLESEGRLYRVKNGRYAVPEKINLVVGRLSVTRKGDGFVNSETGVTDQDVFIPASLIDTAVDGDRVVARVEHYPKGKNPVGRIIKILERAHPRIVGTFHRSKKFGYVEPRERRMNRDVIIPPGEEGGAKERQVVVVRVTSWGDRKMNPSGTVETVLGYLDEPGVDVLTILYGHGLPLDFPEEVEDAAATIARDRRKVSVEGRSDRRDLHVFTIDPSDAKDHDDALSITDADGEGWEVGIHIADVTQFVDPGGIIDTEARERGTSVYLVDRVVPMLPHELSSDLCSLRPDEDRYAVSLFVTLTESGRILDTRFERTVIRSRHRLDYEEVSRVLDGAESIDEETDRAIHLLDQLARQLREKREERGSLDFDLPEARVVLGEEGEPVDIQRVQRLPSHQLIEDFMLLANEVVARKAADRGLPVLYRIHEPPKQESLENLREFLATVGHALPKRAVRPKDLQRILEGVDGTPEEDLVSTAVLRSMNRARYDPQNVGHFGLASRWYTHFTSPIRRYPDLLLHRVVIRSFIEGEQLPEGWAGEELESLGDLTSERERVAQEAERDSVDLKKVEFMERHLGDEFEGAISGVTSFGFFVLLDRYFVEGLVHVNTLDDYYVFLEDQYALVGDRTRRRFRIGDRVRVQVSRVDKEERHIDFRLLDSSF